MMRFFVAIMFVIVIAGLITYFLIPSPLKVSGGGNLVTSTNGSFRVLTRQDIWDKFSPGSFLITKKLLNTVELDVKNENFHFPVSLVLIPLSEDSVAVSWSGTFPVTQNPISKIRQYARASFVNEKMNAALKNFQAFVQQTENIYGFRIEEKSTKDTFLIATRFTTSTVPDNSLIYSYIKKLQSFAQESGVTQTSPPMLNVSTVDSTRFSNMVAIPINSKVDTKDSISFIRMVPGQFRFLTTEVKGGPQTIRSAHKAMAQYFVDFNRISMAIPFEFLVTDRLQERDTTKWITSIYNPVY